MWERPSNIELIPTEEGAFVLDDSNGEYYQLNETAVAVATAATKAASIEELVTRIAEEYEDPDVSGREVSECLHLLVDRGILQPAE